MPALTFEFVGDQFPHAWYFNRFRCDPQDDGSILVTTALVLKNGGMPVVNGFVISKRDLGATKARSLKYLGDLNTVADEAEDSAQSLVLAPSRVYPINLMNLSRVDDVGEIALYRYSMHTLLNAAKASKGATTIKPIACYPVVLFRSAISVQFALLQELLQ